MTQGALSSISRALSLQVLKLNKIHCKSDELELNGSNDVLLSIVTIFFLFCKIFEDRFEIMTLHNIYWIINIICFK